MRLTVECVELLQVETEVAVAALVVMFEGVDGVVEHHLSPVGIQHTELTTTAITRQSVQYRIISHSKTCFCYSNTCIHVCTLYTHAHSHMHTHTLAHIWIHDHTSDTAVTRSDSPVGIQYVIWERLHSNDVSEDNVKVLQWTPFAG